MKSIKKFLFLIFILNSIFVSAQTEPVLSLITVRPGNAIYSAFGHSAFRFLDKENGIDRLYNFGTFDFTAPGFVANFVKGQLDYYLNIEKFKREYRFYSEYEDRSVIEQVLNLTEQEIKSVFDFLENNAKPENRYYKYDFIKDNCSTRIKIVLDSVFGEKIIFPEQVFTAIEKNSYRKEIRSYLGQNPWFDLGIQLALGRVIDKKISQEDSFFLPDQVFGLFEGATTTDGRKLVSSTKTLHKSKQWDEKGSPKILNFPFFVFFILLLFELAFIFAYGRAGKKALIRTLSAFELTLILLNFLFGALLFYLWFISDHSATKNNFNILWCSPLNILFFVFLFFKEKYFMKIFSLFQIAMCLVFFVILITGIQRSCSAVYPAVLLYLLIFWRNSESKWKMPSALCKK